MQSISKNLKSSHPNNVCESPIQTNFGFGPAQLALGNSLVLHEILLNIPNNQELLKTMRFVAKLWNETAVHILNRRKAIVIDFRYHLDTYEFYLTTGRAGWHLLWQKPLKSRALSRFLLLLKNSGSNSQRNLFPSTKFSFTLREGMDPFYCPSFEEFFALYGKTRVRELIFALPAKPDPGTNGWVEAKLIRFLHRVLNYTVHLEQLDLAEFNLSKYAKDMANSKKFTIVPTPATSPPLVLPHMHTLVLTEKIGLNSEIIQRILKGSPNLQIIENMAANPKMPGLLGTIHQPWHVKNAILNKKLTCLKSRSNEMFDLKLKKIKLPGLKLQVRRGQCPMPCFFGPPIQPDEAATLLQNFSKTLQANVTTLREIELTNTLHFYPSFESLPKMDHVTSLRMDATEPCSNNNFAKWLNSSNFPELRHLSFTVYGRCRYCRRPFSGGPRSSLFAFLHQPLEGVRSLEISRRDGSYMWLDDLPRVFPALQTLRLKSLENVLSVSSVLWKMTSLEKLELEIVHQPGQTRQMDSAFTGFCKESLKKVFNLMMEEQMESSLAQFQSFRGEQLLSKAKVTRGASILDLKGLKELDLKITTFDDRKRKRTVSIVSLAPLTAILALGPLQRINGTKVRLWIEDGWSSY